MHVNRKTVYRLVLDLIVKLHFVCLFLVTQILLFYLNFTCIIHNLMYIYLALFDHPMTTIISGTITIPHQNSVVNFKL